MKFKKVILASALILSGLLLSNVTTINAIEELDLPSIQSEAVPTVPHLKRTCLTIASYYAIKT